MIAAKAKDNILKQIYNISFLDEPINLETIDGISPNRKLHIIYYNLVWGCELKLPKIDGIKSLLILLEYIYIKFSESYKISPHLLSRKNEIFYLLIDQLLRMPIDKNDKESLTSLAQYFYDQDFLSSFLLVLNRLDNSLFIKKFTFFSKIIKKSLEDNLELCIIFKRRIINELFTKYDFIKTLMNENQKNSDNEEEKGVSCDINDKDNNKIKTVEIIERLKFIFDQFRNCYDKSVKSLAISIDKYSLKRKIDIREDLKLVTKTIKENETLHAQRNKDIKDTLEELKYKIKGYSSKKERKIEVIKLAEENKFKGKKLIFEDQSNNKTTSLGKEEEKQLKKRDAEEMQPYVKKEENMKNEDEIVEGEVEKDKKVTRKKRLRGKNEKNEGKKKIKEKEENYFESNNERIIKTLKEKVKIIYREENDEEINKEGNENNEKNVQSEGNEEYFEEGRVALRGKKSKKKKINENKNNMNNIKAKNEQKQKKEENISLIVKNDKKEDEDYQNIKRKGRRNSKSSNNVELMINGKEKKNEKAKIQKEIGAQNKIISKISTIKSQLYKLKSPQNEKEKAMSSKKKDISKIFIKNKDNKVEEKESKKKIEIINLIEGKASKRESARRIGKDIGDEIQIIEEPKYESKKEKKKKTIKNK